MSNEKRAPGRLVKCIYIYIEGIFTQVYRDVYFNNHYKDPY